MGVPRQQRSLASAGSTPRRAITTGAIAHFDRAIALFPEFGAAYYGLALSYRALGRTADAERALAQARAVRGPMAGTRRSFADKVLALRDDPAALLSARRRSSPRRAMLPGAISAHESALARIRRSSRRTRT